MITRLPVRLMAIGASSDARTALQMLPGDRVMFTCNDALTIYDPASRTVVESKPAGVGLLGTNGSLVRKSIGGHAVVLVGGSEAVKYVDDSGNNQH